MNLDKQLIRSTAILLALTGLLACAATPELAAQRPIELPELPMMSPTLDMGVIMDRSLSGSHRQVQMSVENGVTTIHATENGVKTYILEDPANGIVVKITRQYGPEQMDQLMEEHPDLYMSAKDFPTQTENAEAVEITVGVTREFAAPSAEALKEKHPEAFQVYTQYTSGHDRQQIFHGRFGGQWMLPEIRIRPDLPAIDPSDVSPPAPKPETKKTDKDT